MITPRVHPLLFRLPTDSPVDNTILPADSSGWNMIVEEACTQGMAGALASWLASAGLPYPPPTHLRTRLARHIAAVAAHNVILERELAQILTSCRHSGIACAPLRGMSLATIVGRDISLRPSGDIDLLVRRDDLAALTDIMQSRGYSEFDRGPGFSRDYSYTLEFATPRHGGILVEPHWTIAYPPFADRMDMDAVWSRCTRGTVAGVETWLLSHEDLLIHLCLHLLHHGGAAPLLWWHELGLMIRQTQATLNWPTVVAIAEQAGLSVLVGNVLETLRDRFGTDLPQSALTRLTARQSPSPVTTLLINAPDISGREEFSQLVALPHVRAKLRYALGLLFPSPTYMRLRYGTSNVAQLSIAYLGRVLRIVWEGIRWTAALLGTMRPARPSPSR